MHASGTVRLRIYIQARIRFVGDRIRLLQIWEREEVHNGAEEEVRNIANEVPSLHFHVTRYPLSSVDVALRLPMALL